jgi:hypothetical protein
MTTVAKPKVVLATDPASRDLLTLDRLAAVADVDLDHVVSDFFAEAPALLADAENLFTCWDGPR